MRILICFLIVLSNCQINFPYRSQDRCDIQEITGQIKYLYLIEFFQQRYDDDLKEYQTYFKQQQKAFDDTSSQRTRLIKQYQEIGLKINIQEISENQNPNDSQVEKSYKQLLEIQNFMNIFKEAQELLSFQIILKQSNYQGDVFDQFLILYESRRVHSTIAHLKDQYFSCTGRYFKDEIIQYLDQDQKKPFKPLPLRRPKSSINKLQISSSEVVNLKDFENQIELKDCPSKTQKIQSLYLEFQKLFQLSEFRTNYNLEQIKAFQLFFEKNDQVSQDKQDCKTKIILKQKQNKLLIYDKLRKLLYDKQVIEIFNGEMTNNQKAKLIKRQIKDKPIYQLISLLIYEESHKFQLAKDHAQQFLMLDQKYLPNLQEIFKSLMQFIKNFNYSKDYINKGIQYFERDLKICESQNQIQNKGGQSDAVSQDRINYSEDKIKKQEESQTTKIQNSGEQQKAKSENQAEQCQQKLLNIEQKIYQYQQAIEMNRFIQYIQHYDKTFNDLEKIQQNIFTTIQNLDKYQQLFEIQEKLYFVEIYPTHQDPEDKTSVQAYENLLKLQNLIVFLSNSFSKAEELLDFDSDDIQSYENQYKDLKKNYKIDIYPDDKVKKQLEDGLNDYEQCSQNKQIFPGSFSKNGQDYRKENNYYWFVKKFYPSIPLNLLILPIIVEEFEIKDISNYDKSSEKCKADIEGIIEDTLETLKIIELLKYKQAGQNQYDQMISQALKFKNEFFNRFKNYILKWNKQTCRIN